MDSLAWLGALTSAGVRNGTAARWVPLFVKHVQPEAFSRGAEEMKDFVGQILHESQMLERTEENLYYSTPEQLCKVWHKRFPTVQAALPYLMQPQKLANFVYGGRMGNSESDDGWRYRGRGLVMVTGHDNYAAVEKASGVPLLSQPDRLSEPEIALLVSIAWWERSIPDSAVGDVPRLTRLVQGGAEGLNHREELTQSIKETAS